MTLGHLVATVVVRFLFFFHTYFLFFLLSLVVSTVQTIA